MQFLVMFFSIAQPNQQASLAIGDNHPYKGIVPYVDSFKPEDARAKVSQRLGVRTSLVLPRQLR
jgi:hypothetical protein